SGRIQRGASRLAADLLESLDQERLGGMVKQAIGNRLRTIDLAPMLGQALQGAMAEDRHVPLIDGLIRQAARLLDANQHLIRDMVHERAGTILRWTGLDETLANAIIDGLYKLILDMAGDTRHPVRARIEEALQKLAFDLQFDARTQARVETIKEELLANP